MMVMMTVMMMMMIMMVMIINHDHDHENDSTSNAYNADAIARTINPLSNVQMKRLDKIGCEWDKIMFQWLEAYKKKHGHCLVVSRELKRRGCIHISWRVGKEPKVQKGELES
jgi:hypothetical protein